MRNKTMMLTFTTSTVNSFSQYNKSGKRKKRHKTKKGISKRDKMMVYAENPRKLVSMLSARSQQ